MPTRTHRKNRRRFDGPDDVDVDAETGEGNDGHRYSTFRGKSVGPFRHDY